MAKHIDPDPFAEFGAFVPDPTFWRITFTPDAQKTLAEWDRERAREARDDGPSKSKSP